MLTAKNIGINHFIWNSRKAWIERPEDARWLEEVVMPAYNLPRYDRRIPLDLRVIFENATPGCCEDVEEVVK